MVHSDWGDWLPRRIAAADPDGVAIWSLGCNGFVLKDEAGTTLFIDPYLGTGDPPRTVRMIPVPFEPTDVVEADAILGTHEHVDHVHGPTQGPILARTGATLYAPGASVRLTEEEAWVERWHLEREQVVAVEAGDRHDIGAFSVTVGPAYDPDADEPVSYVIEHPAGTVFHAGDSKPTDAFERLGADFDIDVAIVAFGSTGYLEEAEGPARTTWYCDENEAVSIASAVRAETLLPSHWDMWRGVRADPTVLYRHIQSWTHPEALTILEIGDRVDL